MLFNSFEFFVFLPIVFLLYWFVFKPLRWQNLFVVVASYVFYGFWDWRFLILIAFTTLCSYASGVLIERFEGNRRKQKWLSVGNIVINLSILGVFKYFNFFAENFAALFRLLGFEADWATLHLMLPVGISFYTFQALSYTIDVYQRKNAACHDIVAFFAYISFFPQLVAGPIERSTNLLPQMMNKRTFDYAKAVDGCRQILWGFFKKVVVADTCAGAVNTIWANYTDQSGLMLLIGGVLFTFQIYGDFSGYSDIAIGTARLFGINLMRNFNFPFFSRDIAEFWRRWHISLTTWFRDYIYFPLGGSRCSLAKTMRNTLIIYLVSGFWHGANWTFIVWGAYNAFLFFPLMLLKLNRKHTDIVAKGHFFPSVKELLQILLTFALCVFGWIIFRSENIAQAWDYICRIFSFSSFGLGAGVTSGRKALSRIATLLIVEWIQRDKQHALQLPDKRGFWRVAYWCIYLIIAFACITRPGQKSDFIYFQF